MAKNFRTVAKFFKRWCDPRDWWAWFIIAILLMFEPILPCIGGNWFMGPDPAWRWRRMWKSDAQVKKEEELRRARCCANGRNEWRDWARKRGLIPRKAKHPRLQLEIENVKHAIRKTTGRLTSRLSSSIGLHHRQNQSSFLHLPPEIRQLMYLHCVEDWTTIRPRSTDHSISLPLPPHEPPITRVSRLIRSESLATFYQSYRFPLVLHLQNELCNPTFAAVEWYYFLGPTKLSMIRHLELHLCCKNNGHARLLDPVIMNIDLEPDNIMAYWTNEKWLFRESPCLPSIPHLESEQTIFQRSRLVINQNEEQFLNELMKRVRTVAQNVGSTGIVSAHDIYKFVK